jgi:NADP-dependent 3-hydroxy acid dehydrogenase YdfG
LNASIAASSGTEGSSVYSAAKAAVRSFARTWTNDLKGRKIRVNVFRSVVLVSRMSSLRRWSSWRPMTAVLLPVLSWWWIAE